MKRSFLYMLILAVVLLLPAKATDVGKLRPVQTIAVYKAGAAYVIETDTEDIGRGESLSAAIENLKATTPATIYLDTAQYLLVRDETLLDMLKPYLKDTVRVCQFKGKPPMDQVSKFLSAHAEKVTLDNWEKGNGLPLLDCTKGRLEFFVK
ncbi:MAG: hypothetical protein IKU57_04745 [Oscillospiraceae bacterium]|nr:hypothetical protein [Oscillospiraceae bacterium]